MLQVEAEAGWQLYHVLRTPDAGSRLPGVWAWTGVPHEKVGDGMSANHVSPLLHYHFGDRRREQFLSCADRLWRPW